ncbi:elongation factor P 5-aminopentanone reductase [Faecalispora anaeroviscerum]|uniref:elongation factor P 5-aminopentanone reductase n=1 Tax=Faecalispora anaeroviscerum TaxID=2991836 RepID=UPI0024BA286D|nr:3-oxoacyl-ACP reductase FabG [Faecalispora anaeroviscerum]
MEEHKTVLITGASRGIGSEIARRFALAGYRVVLNYNRSEQQARELAKTLELQLGVSPGERVLPVCADVADRQQVEKMFDEAESHFGGIDVLVNNAGIAQQKLITDLTDDDWRRMFAVHVDGAFYCSRRALQGMVRRHSGKIINVSSMWGQIGGSCEVHYSAAKAALIGMTRALAKEVGPSGVQVNCVAPGVIDTEMNGALAAETLEQLCEETPLGMLGTCRDIAEAVLFLADSRSDFITGQVLGVNGGMVIG